MKKTPLTIILLRGMIRDQRHWGGFPALLTEKFRDSGYSTLKILSYDIAGNGQRYEEKSATTIAEMTEDLRRHSDTNSRVLLITISLGGMIGLDWTARYPESTSGLVLINSSNSAFSPPYQRLYPKAFFRFLWSFIFNRNARSIERLVLKTTANTLNEDREENLINQWTKWRQETPVSFSNVLRQLSAAIHFRCVEKPNVPLLVLSSKKDRLVNSACSVDIAKHWESDFHQHPHAGHDLPLDQPGWVSDHILAWYQDHIDPQQTSSKQQSFQW